MTDEPLTFLASFPNVQSAIRVAGDGGARITLDIPETEMPAIVRLMLLRGMSLRIMVAPEIGLINKNGRTQKQSKQSAWAPAQEPGAHDDA